MNISFQIGGKRNSLPFGLYTKEKRLKRSFYEKIDGGTISEQIHSSFNYSTTKFGGFLSGSYNFYASYNKANFYDLFGPTKRSRKGFNFGMDYNQSIIYDLRKFNKCR